MSSYKTLAIDVVQIGPLPINFEGILPTSLLWTPAKSDIGKGWPNNAYSGFERPLGTAYSPLRPGMGWPAYGAPAAIPGYGDDPRQTLT